MTMEAKHTKTYGRQQKQFWGEGHTRQQKDVQSKQLLMARQGAGTATECREVCVWAYVLPSPPLLHFRYCAFLGLGDFTASCRWWLLGVLGCVNMMCWSFSMLFMFFWGLLACSHVFVLREKWPQCLWEKLLYGTKDLKLKIPGSYSLCRNLKTIFSFCVSLSFILLWIFHP